MSIDSRYSSSVETTGSTSSLPGTHSASSSINYDQAESWDEGCQGLIPTGSEDETDRAWRDGVTLRKGWEFLDATTARTQDMGLGNRSRKRFSIGDGAVGAQGGLEANNRLSIAETVKPSSHHASNRSSHEQLSSTLDARQSSPSPSGSHLASAASSSPSPYLVTFSGRKSRASSVGATGFLKEHSPSPPPSFHKPTRVAVADPSTPPPPRNSSTRMSRSTAGRTPPLHHSRSFSQAQTEALGPKTSPTGAGCSVPSLPLKPTWLQSNPLALHPSTSEPIIGDYTFPSCPNTPSRKETPTQAAALDIHLVSPSLQSSPTLPSSSSSILTPLQPAPLLPPRPPQVHKYVAEAEFTSSFPPTASGSSSRGPGKFGLSSGLKGRLAAFSGAVGGVATGVYNEGNQYFQSISNPSSTQSSQSTSSALSSSTTSTTSSSYPPQTVPPRQRSFPQTLFAAPGSAVRHLNSSWRARAASPSSPVGTAFQWQKGFSRPVVYDPNAMVPGEMTGKVFGHELERVAREWSITSEGGSDPRGEMGEGLVRGRARVVLPALVVRCVEYLEVWGPREEGIFRISGRSTHIQKLRTQFDTGADIDLKLSDPGELDPHAVASIFKAYLRELPSSILTVALTPAFDNLMRIHVGSSARDGSFGATKTLPAVDFPETHAVGGKSKAVLVAEMKTRLRSLPEVNWHLLDVVVGILDHAARHADINKMTVSNLLLVFCPSLCFSPPFLKLLIENRSVLFESPPEATTETVSQASSTTSAALLPKPNLPPRPATLKPPSRTPSSSSIPLATTPEESRMGSDREAPVPQLDLPPSLPTLFSKLSYRSSKESVNLPPSPRSVKKKTSSLNPDSGPPSPWRRHEKAFDPQDKEPASLLTLGAPIKSPGWSEQGDREIIKLVDSPKKKGSYFDLLPADGSQVNLNSPPSSLYQPSPPLPFEQSKPDRLLPSGVVASRRHLFSTPIADRFKSTTTPHLPSLRSTHSRNRTIAEMPTEPSSDSTFPTPELTRSHDSTTSLNRQVRRGNGGGFFSSRGSSASLSKTSGESVEASTAVSKPAKGGVAKKKTMWKRSSVMVGLGTGVEDEARKSVREAVKALEGHSAPSR